MKSEDVELIAPISNIIGVAEAVKHIWRIKKDFKKAAEALRLKRPDILILIDYPDFNLALAKKGKSEGIPVLYYVSPQVWAWRRGRVKRISSLVNKIAVLFPFEVDYYLRSGLPCVFVGHPIAETIDIKKTKDQLKKELGLVYNRPVITLLPGSRPDEIQRHIQLISDIAEMVHREMPEFQIVVPLAKGSEHTEVLADYIAVVKGRTKEAVACSEVSAVSSGTATLEAALLGTPMVVFYRLSPLTFFIAKILAKVDYISLVNLLSRKQVVPELIQKEATAGNIFSELKRVLNDVPYRYNMISSLKKIREIVGDKGASARVASMVGEITGWNNTDA
jgi:lipid-A-disaccharide synthase